MLDIGRMYWIINQDSFPPIHIQYGSETNCRVIWSVSGTSLLVDAPICQSLPVGVSASHQAYSDGNAVWHINVDMAHVLKTARRHRCMMPVTGIKLWSDENRRMWLRSLMGRTVRDEAWAECVSEAESQMCIRLVITHCSAIRA
jgi:hypothetical protein